MPYVQRLQQWLSSLLAQAKPLPAEPDQPAKPRTRKPAEAAPDTGDAGRAKPRPVLLGKPAIQAMPDFPGLDLAAISVADTPEQIEDACRTLEAAGTIGFDTESKPTFNKGETAQGPHLIQLSTASHAYLFPVRNNRLPIPLRQLLESSAIRKVGFDLRSDLAMLASNTGVHCRGVDDLVTQFRQRGYRNTVGAVQAVALLFGQHYRKSKSTKMSNWAAVTLSDSQRRYAANDAYVALRVYQALAKAR